MLVYTIIEHFTYFTYNIGHDRLWQIQKLRILIQILSERVKLWKNVNSLYS